MQREFIEIAPYTWWALVADPTGRTMHPTWRKPVKAYGPFSTQKAAEDETDDIVTIALLQPLAA